MSGSQWCRRGLDSLVFFFFLLLLNLIMLLSPSSRARGVAPGFGNYFLKKELIDCICVRGVMGAYIPVCAEVKGKHWCLPLSLSTSTLFFEVGSFYQIQSVGIWTQVPTFIASGLTHVFKIMLENYGDSEVSLHCICVKVLTTLLVLAVEVPVFWYVRVFKKTRGNPNNLWLYSSIQMTLLLLEQE